MATLATRKHSSFRGAISLAGACARFMRRPATETYPKALDASLGHGRGREASRDPIKLSRCGVDGWNAGQSGGYWGIRYQFERNLQFRSGASNSNHQPGYKFDINGTAALNKVAQEVRAAPTTGKRVASGILYNSANLSNKCTAGGTAGTLVSL